MDLFSMLWVEVIQGTLILGGILNGFVVAGWLIPRTRPPGLRGRAILVSLLHTVAAVLMGWNFYVKFPPEAVLTRHAGMGAEFYAIYMGVFVLGISPFIGFLLCYFTGTVIEV